MTKSTITRERLEWLSRISCRDDIEDIGGDEIRELANIALAAMDSEPVGEFYEDGPLNWYQISDGDRVPAHRRIPLYRHAQSAPVVNYVPLGDSPYDVPYSMPSNLREFIDQEIGILFSEDDAQGVWIACRRAAMLAAAPQSPGSEPATVPGKWIPVSERMPSSRHEVLVGCWWGEKPLWCCKLATYIPGHPDAQSSGWLIPGASWTPTHWMSLPSAPQEVNGE